MIGKKLALTFDNNKILVAIVRRLGSPCNELDQKCVLYVNIIKT